MKGIHSIILALTVLFLIAPFLFIPGITEPFFFDIWTLFASLSHSHYDISEDIVLILIDRESEERLGIPLEGKKWRQFDPAVIDTCTRAGAAVIAIDIEYSGEETPWDENLAHSFRKAGNVVTAEMDHGATVPLLARSVKVTGNAAVAGKGGIPKRVYVYPDKNSQPAFSIAAARLYEKELRDRGLSFRTSEKTAKTLARVEEEGSFLINFGFPSSWFPVYGYTDILYASEKRMDDMRRTPVSVMKDKIIVIAKDFQKDKVPIPGTFGTRVFGGLVHAFAMETLISGRVIKETPLPVTLIAAVAMIMLISLGYRTKGGRPGFFIGLFSVIAVISASIVLFTRMDLWLPPAAPITAGILTIAIHGVLKRRLLSREFRSANAQLKRLDDFNRKLQESGRLKDILTDTLVHDIKNAIAAIEGSLTFVSGKYREDRQSLRMFHAASLACTDIITLSSNLLDIRRMEEGHTDVRLVPISLDEVNSMIERIGQYPLVFEKGISLEVHLQEEPVFIHADSYLTGQIVHNLMNNAIKYTPAGGRIEIRFSRADERVSVSFHNQGLPIPDGQKERIFEKYNTSGGKRSRYSKGLGLFFCRLAMELQGGRIWVETDEKGNTFILDYKQAPVSGRPGRLQA